MTDKEVESVSPDEWAKALEDARFYADNDRLYHPAPLNVARALLAAQAEIERLTKALSASEEYLLNAKIDLETGAPKRTAVNTIDGGLKVVRAALAAYRKQDDGEK